MPKKRKAAASDSASTTSTTNKKAKTITVSDRTRPVPTVSPVQLVKATKKKRTGSSIDPIDLSSDNDMFVEHYVLKHETDCRCFSSFYSSNNNSSSSTPIQQSLNKLFDQYRDSPKTEPDKILINGVQSYLSDLSIALDEVVHFALCDLLTVTSVGEFERDAFTSGWLSASTSATSNTNPRSNAPAQPFDTVSRQAAHIASLRKRLTTDPAYFKTIYRSAFKLAKPENQRSVPLESALEFWKMFFSSSSGGIEWNTRGTKWLDLWLEFYETQSKRPVNKDLWNMVGELVIKTKEPGGESLEWWTEDGAWPMAVDEFVAWVKDKRKANGEDAMDIS